MSDLWTEFFHNRPLRIVALFFITAFAMMSVGNAAGAYFMNDLEHVSGKETVISSTKVSLAKFNGMKNGAEKLMGEVLAKVRENKWTDKVKVKVTFGKAFAHKTFHRFEVVFLGFNIEPEIRSFHNASEVTGHLKLICSIAHFVVGCDIQFRRVVPYADTKIARLLT